MFNCVKRWYNGKSKVQEFENNLDSSVLFLPYLYTEYHWSAKIVRAIVSFYIRHWKWIWTSIIAILGVYVERSL